MGSSVESQAYIFFATLYGGIIIGFIYDIYRIFRYFSEPRKIVSFIEDLIFWILVSLIALFILFFSNFGEVRGFVFLGFISGAIIYNKLLSKLVITTLVKILRYLFRGIKVIFNIILFPFKKIKNYFYTPYKKVKTYIGNKIKRLRKFLKLPSRIFYDIKKHTKSIIFKK
ncbi:MAG: spore cortex biosynthesis protein YabQ [Firmicutes bacterium]|nr:spore cortex biosynthesis protein YabQ [Bacillota bacterium]